MLGDILYSFLATILYPFFLSFFLKVRLRSNIEYINMNTANEPY